MTYSAIAGPEPRSAAVVAAAAGLSLLPEGETGTTWRCQWWWLNSALGGGMGAAANVSFMRICYIKKYSSRLTLGT